MGQKKFTDVLLLVLGKNRLFRWHHMSDPTKSKFKDADGRIYDIDLSKSYLLKGWVPWKEWEWWHPWSILSEWHWRSNHRIAMLIYQDAPPNTTEIIKPTFTFLFAADDYTDMTPRDYEAFIESRIPMAYYRKWTTGSGKIPLYIWILLGVLVIAVIVIMARGGL